MATHVQDQALLGSIESSLRQAAQLGLVADADLATDKATILSNIETRNAKLIAGQEPDLFPQYLALREAIEVGCRVLGVTTMITDLATIYAAIDGDWQGGFAVGI